MTLPRPPNNPPPPSPPLIAPTGSPGVNCVVDVINQTAAPFRSAPPPEQGAAGAVAQYVGGAMAVIGAPAQIIDTAFAALTAPLAALFPSMPAVTLLGMHVGIPHTHTHPPSFIPPAPPIPLPSIGVLLASGSVAVLVGGLPAARAGDIGISVTCGSLAPPFEVFTGSSNVFIGGQRAARVLDITKHCNPTSLGVFGAIMGAAGVAAGAAAAAGSAAAGTTGAAIAQGAQAAADAAAMALKVLCGKDPGLPPGMGALVGPPVPNVLIGGFPCPPVGDLAVGGLMKLLKSLARAAKSKFSSRRGNACCGNSGEPIYLVTGENFSTFTDFVSPGLFEWKRHYTSGRNRRDSALGFCTRHHYERELRVRLHKAVFTDWDGVEIGFPRFERGETTTRSNGYMLERLAPGRYLVSYRGQPSMEFRGGEFDVTLRLTRLFDDHRELRLGYDDLGRLVTFADWDERTQRTTRYELHYDRDDRITELIELPPSGASILRSGYAYDRKGDLVGVEDALGGRWRYEYDYRHCLTVERDPNGYTYTFGYDTLGRCVRSSGEDGLWWTEISYFPEDRMTRYREGDNAQWEIRYDDEGFITKIIDPYVGELIRERDGEGKIACEIDSGGRVLEWLYDENGAHYTRQDEYGFIYPPELEMARLPNPFVRELPSTPLERLFAGLLTPSEYASMGIPSCDDSDGIARSQLFHSIPEELRERAAQVFRVRRSGELCVEHQVREEHDALGRRVQEEDNLGHRRRWRYDAAGNEIEYHDRDGKVYQQRTTSWNLVGERLDPLGHGLRYRYSSLEQIIGITDPLGNVSSYDYDLKERLVRVRRHGRLREEYLYDRGDHFVEKRDGQGRVLFRNETHPNHLVAVRHLSSGGFHRYDYDASGGVTEASTELHTVRLRHDGLGRRVGDFHDDQGVGHRYSHDGKLVRTQVLSRYVLKCETTRWGATFVDEPNGRRTLLRSEDAGLVLRQCENGTVELLQYDHEGRLLGRLSLRSGRGGGYQSWSVRYRYSAEGDLLGVTDSERGTTTYEIDDAHRLVGEITPDGCRLSYVLDEAGNVLSKPGLLQAVFDSGNRLSATESETFTFDERNHVSTRRRDDGSLTRYVYDSFDMLICVERTRPDGTAWPPVVLEHDGLGRLIALRCGESVREFFWDGDRLAAEILVDGRLRIFTYAGIDALVPLSFTEYEGRDSDPGSGQTYFIFSDPVGMPFRIEDETGAVVWQALRIDPYGRVDIDPSGRLEYNLRWPGHYFASEIGLHCNRYRVYDPDLGRYLQSDPLGYEGSEVNLYAYCKNPLIQVDILGLRHKGRRGRSRRNDGQEGTEASGVPRKGSRRRQQLDQMVDQARNSRRAQTGERQNNHSLTSRGESPATVTRAEADYLGRRFVGDGAQDMSNGQGLVGRPFQGQDGQTYRRQYRQPTEKPNSPYSKTGVQSNFETQRFETTTETVYRRGSPPETVTTSRWVNVSDGHVDVAN